MEFPLPVKTENLDGDKGYKFHRTLLISFLLQSLKSGRRDRRLNFSAEVMGLGAWDDIIVEETVGGKIKWTLFQAKHIENKKISYQSLAATKGDYSLIKYFVSFLEAKKTAMECKPNAEIENIVICTTSEFDRAKAEVGEEEARKVTVAKNRTENLQFDVISSLKSKVCRRFLNENILINNVTCNMISKREKLRSLLSLTEVQKEIQSAKIQRKAITIEISEKNLDTEVIDFCEKFIICAQCPKVDSFTENVKRELKVMTSLEEVEEFYSHFFDKFHQWLRAKLPVPVTITSFREMLEEAAAYHQQSAINPYAETIRNVSQIQFHDISALSNIVAQTTNKLKVVCVNSELSNFKLYQVLQEARLQFAVIPLLNLIAHFRNISKFLRAQICKLYFVIDCSKGTEAEVINCISMLQQDKDIERRQNVVLLLPISVKKVISSRPELLLQLEILDSDVKVTFPDFTKECQDSILQKNVSFQYKPTQLGAILTTAKVSYNILSEPFLERLLLRKKTIEVGIDLPDIQKTEPYYIPRKLLPRIETSERNDYQWDLKNLKNFVECNERRIVLAADPGMGKSTFLQHMAQEIAVTHPQHLVIYINLADCSKLLKDMKNEPETDDFQLFLHSALKVSNNPVMKYVLNPWMATCPDRMVILIDSFDEISPDYESKVTRFIRFLTSRNPSRLCVATRYHTLNHLEVTLSMFAYTLGEFTRDDQIEFLRKFWKLQLKREFSEVKFLSFTDYLFQFLRNSIDDSQSRFMGLPLQTRMVAEAFCDKFKAWIRDEQNAEGSSLFPSHFNIYQLYKEFINRKYDILVQEKLKQNPHVAGEETRIKTEKKYFMKAATELAMKTGFFAKDLKAVHDLCSIQKTSKYNLMHCKRVLTNLFKPLNANRHQKPVNAAASSKRDKNQELPYTFTGRDGVVVVSSDGECRFVHGTFAEFFVGRHLAKIIKLCIPRKLPEKMKALLATLREKNRYRVVCIFMEFCICQDLPLHRAVLSDNVKETEALMQRHCNDSDCLGRSAVHVALHCKRYHIVRSLLRIPQRVDAYHALDQLGHSPFIYTMHRIQGSQYDIHYAVLYLLLRNERSASVQHQPVIKETKKEDLADIRKFLGNQVQAFITHLRDLSTQYFGRYRYDEEKARDAFYGGCLGDLVLDSPSITPTIKHLVNKLTKNGKYDDNSVVTFDCVVFGDSPMSWRVIFGDDDACRRSLSTGEDDANAADKLGRTFLHLAAYCNHDHIVNVLHEFGCRADVHDAFGDDPLAVAARRKHWSCVAALLLRRSPAQNLHERRDIDWDEVLNRAAWDGYDDIVGLCLSHNVNPNKQHYWGHTSLHWAALYGRVDSVGVLLSAGADQNITNNDGETHERLMMDNNFASADAKRRVAEMFEQHKQKNRMGEAGRHSGETQISRLR